MPAATACTGASTCAARANVRYGDWLRITAQGADRSAPFMITALALVRRKLGGVLRIGEKRQVAGAGVLDLRHAADLDGGIALNRAVQTPSQLAEGHGIENITSVGSVGVGHPLDEPGHARHVQAMGDVANHAMARAAIERKRTVVSSVSAGFGTIVHATPWRAFTAPRQARKCPTTVKVKR